MRIQLRDVIKSRDVEDPVNLWVHRPLQLAIARPLMSTPITPNQVTLIALLCGLGGAYCIFLGTPTSLLVGAGLIFASAIVDGVDGMVARFKKMSSDAGHAIDGASDYAVNVATHAAAIWYLAQTTGRPLLALALGIGAHVACAHHIMLYDFHCATYLRFLTRGKHKGGDYDKALELAAKMEAERAPLWKRVIVKVYAWQLGNRESFLAKVNPVASGFRELPVDDQTGDAYVARHRTTMRGWALLGNAPHMDLFALATATGRFDLYFLLRIFGFSFLAIVLVLWERRVSKAPLFAMGAGEEATA